MSAEAAFGGRLPPALDDEALLPYARLLADLVYRRRYPSGEVELTVASEDALFDRALAVVLEQMIADQLVEMPPGELARLYREVRGDSRFAQCLDHFAQLHEAETQRALRSARLRYEATVSGRLRLDEVPPGEVLTVGLFDPTRPDLAARRFSDNAQLRPLHRILQARVVGPGGQVEVIGDTWVGAVWSQQLRTTAVAPFTGGVLGSGQPGDRSAPPRPELTRHAPITFRAGDGTDYTPPQIVGYVRTLDGEVLLDG